MADSRRNSITFFNSTTCLSSAKLSPKTVWDDKVKFSRNKKKTRLAALLDESDIQHVRLSMAARMLTLADYSYITQFGSNGYYQKGRVKFINEISDGHYYTFASKGYALAHSLAERLYEQWRLVHKEEKFEVLELGAGDGDLCFKILSYLENKAKNNAGYAKFYKRLHYNIIDKSKALHQRQREKLGNLAHKVDFHIGDALQLDQSSFKKHANVVLSNELMDMFPPHQIIIGKDYSVNVRVIVPMIDLAKIKKYCQFDDNKLNQIKTSCERYRQFLKFDAPILPLDKHLFNEIFSCCNEEALQANLFEFKKTCIPIKYVPKLNQHLKYYPELLRGMHPGDRKHVQIGLHPFMQHVSQLGDLVISIDYAENTFNMTNLPMHTNGEDDTKSHLFDHPGLYDITMDVDLTAQISAAVKTKMKYVGTYGQNALIPPDLKQDFLHLNEDLENQNLFYFTMFARRDIPSFQIDPELAIPMSLTEMYKERSQKALTGDI